MQIALDPHPARAVVGPAVFSAGYVGVEHTRATAVEGERAGRHLAELGPERVGVRLHESGERLHKAVDDERFPLVAKVARCGHAYQIPAPTDLYVVRCGDTADMSRTSPCRATQSSLADRRLSRDVMLAS